MNTGEVKAFFRRLAAEPDLTFFDASAEQGACKRGHNRFRRIVIKHRPKFWETFVDITISNLKEIDLAGGPVTLFGAAPSVGHAALKITSMAQIDSSSAITSLYRFCRSRSELLSAYDLTDPVVLMSGRKIEFPDKISGTFRLYYVPNSSVDWTSNVAFVDDFSEYHDLIAYFAYEEYAALDQAFPDAIRLKLDRLQREFVEHLSEGVVLDVDQVSYEANW